MLLGARGWPALFCCLASGACVGGQTGDDDWPFGGQTGDDLPSCAPTQVSVDDGSQWTPAEADGLEALGGDYALHGSWSRTAVPDDWALRGAPLDGVLTVTVQHDGPGHRLVGGCGGGGDVIATVQLRLQLANGLTARGQGEARVRPQPFGSGWTAEVQGQLATAEPGASDAATDAEWFGSPLYAEVSVREGGSRGQLMVDPQPLVAGPGGVPQHAPPTVAARWPTEERDLVCGGASLAPRHGPVDDAEATDTCGPLCQDCSLPGPVVLGEIVFRGVDHVMDHVVYGAEVIVRDSGLHRIALDAQGLAISVEWAGQVADFPAAFTLGPQTGAVVAFVEGDEADHWESGQITIELSAGTNLQVHLMGRDGQAVYQGRGGAGATFTCVASGSVYVESFEASRGPDSGALPEFCEDARQQLGI